MSRFVACYAVLFSRWIKLTFRCPPLSLPRSLSFKKFVPSAPASDAVVSKFGGDPDGSQEGIEADLDIQYIMGVAPGIKTEFWEQKSSDFCADLIKWTGAFK